MSEPYEYETTAELPVRFPIFPLPGTLLFPRSLLPLNIFEPRYLNMLDDVRAGDGLIGMIQSFPTGPKTHPDIADVGCLGQLASFTETEDGRYIIALKGLARFRVSEELPLDRPYREVRADWTEFEHDFLPPDTESLPPRDVIFSALIDYLERRGLEANLDASEDAPLEMIINALCAACPFTVIEKQALLVAPDLETRCNTLLALLEMGSDNGGESPFLN